MRTHGHLEYDKETNKPISFICVNTLLSREEGLKGLIAMKERFSAKVLNKNQEAIMPKEEDIDDEVKSEVGDSFFLRNVFSHLLIVQCGETKLTMDYNKLEEMISNHLCNISPTLKSANDEVPEPEYLKCMAASNQLPPPMVRKS